MLFAYFCIKHLWQTVRYSKGCHALIYRLSSLTCSCFIYKHDTMMIHWCINASCSAISQIKGLHTRCVILNQTRDLTCPWLMTHFRLDSSCDTLSPVLTISLLPRQRNKILCVVFFKFFFLVSHLLWTKATSSHWEYSVNGDYLLKSSVSLLDATQLHRHLQIGILEDVLSQIISFTFEDYTEKQQNTDRKWRDLRFADCRQEAQHL